MLDRIRLPQQIAIAPTPRKSTSMTASLGACEAASAAGTIAATSVASKPASRPFAAVNASSLMPATVTAK